MSGRARRATTVRGRAGRGSEAPEAPIPTAPTDPVRGLTEAEAATRRSRGLGNEYRPPTSRTWREIVGENAYLGINGPLVVISLLLLAIGRPIDAALTAGPVIGNVLIGVVQEARAKEQLDRIALLARPRATVVRDGVERSIDPEGVVIGDLLIARRGEQAMVDGRLVEGSRVELDEALLTGESDPVPRGPGEPIRAGSAVAGGTACFVAERVGRLTTVNEMLDEARGIRGGATPLQREIERTIWGVAGIVVAVAGIVALTSLSAEAIRSESTLVAAAVLVTLVPQGLAIMVTVTYAAGALRVSRLGALVQRRNAVESMSRVDTLCFDKTGTLTTQRIDFLAAVPVGDPARPGGPLPPGTTLGSLLGALAASTGAPTRTTEALARSNPGAACELDDEVPFSSDRRWSALRVAGTPGGRAPAARSAVGQAARQMAAEAVGGNELPGGSTWVIGAPELLAGAAADAVPGADAGRSAAIAIERAAELAALGRRVLLLARSADGSPLRDATGRPALPAALEPVALLAFDEELRPDAAATLADFAAAGVDLKVLSGDDPATVEAIGRRVGLPIEGPRLAGPELAALDEPALGRAAATGTVFGRVEPALKARLVTALRHRRRYVAMVGDGVNDLLPLRRANLGIAMESGSPATRGAADIVLLGDAFSVLPRAVVEGRRILAAMEATLVILLARTFYVLLIVVGAALAGLPFPITPRQNSGLAFVTVGVPLIVLALWVPPRRTPRSLVLDTLGLSIPASIAVALVALPVYATAIARGATVEEAQTILTTMTVFCGLGLLPLVHPAGRDPLLSIRARAWPWLLAAVMAALFGALLGFPPARAFYELVPLEGGTFASLLAIGLLWTAAVHLVRLAGIVGRIERLVFRALGRLGRS